MCPKAISGDWHFCTGTVESDAYIKSSFDDVIIQSKFPSLILPMERNYQEECYEPSHRLSERSLQNSNPTLYASITATYTNAVISTWVIFAVPGHPVILKAMDNIVSLIKGEYSRSTSLSPSSRGEGIYLAQRSRMVICLTGPMMLTRTIVEYQIDHNVSFSIESPNVTVLRQDLKAFGGIAKVNKGNSEQSYYRNLLQNPKIPMLSSYNLTSLVNSSNGAHLNRRLHPQVFDLQDMHQSMNDLNSLLRMLESAVPFAFAHFNDGEIEAIDCVDTERTVDFGWQRCSNELSASLRRAMLNSPYHMYVGIPCVCEHFTRPFVRALQILNITLVDTNAGNASIAALTKAACLSKPPVFQTIHSAVPLRRITAANLFVNANLVWYAQSEMMRILNARAFQISKPVFLFVGNNSDPSLLPFPSKAVYLPSKNAFDSHYHQMRTAAYLSGHNITHGDIVLLMIGPLGRVLTSEWAHILPNTTFLNVGSFYDQFMWGRHGRNIAKHRACMSKEDVQAVLDIKSSSTSVKS